PGGGSGLAGLRERLAALDGTLEAGRVSGGRFRVTARVPVGARVQEEVGAPGGTRPAVGPRVPEEAGVVEEARVPEETR
ncbi:sensor histidine kinase, partial [Streptomyces sp. WAC05374]